MTDYSSKRQVVAHHEAGHAVAMWQGSLRFKNITVEPDDAYLGRVLAHRIRLSENQVIERSPRTRDRLERHIVALLAGPEAQRVLTGRYSYGDAREDRRVALDLLDRLVDSVDEVRPYFTWLQTKARCIVQHPRYGKAVEALADALCSLGTLTERDAIVVMQRAVTTVSL